MGFPPGYNFGACLFDNWLRFGQYTFLSQADEQGLLMYTLNEQPNFRITKFDIRELMEMAAERDAVTPAETPVITS